MINNSFGNSTTGIHANSGELCALEDFSYVGISSQLISFLFTGSQVTTYEAKARLVQSHAYWNTTLQSKNNTKLSILSINLESNTWILDSHSRRVHATRVIWSTLPLFCDMLYQDQVIKVFIIEMLILNWKSTILLII